MIRSLLTMPVSQRNGLIFIVCTGILLLASQVVWGPWETDLTVKREELAKIRYDLAEIERRADELSLLTDGQEGKAELLIQINMLASKNGVQLESVRPIGNVKVSFRFSSVDPVVFWPWVAEMEEKNFRFERLMLSSVSHIGRLGGQAIVVQVVK